MEDLTPQRKREMKRLLRKIVTFIDNQAIYPRGNVFLDKVVLAHVSKALNVAQSIMALIDAASLKKPLAIPERWWKLP